MSICFSINLLKVKQWYAVLINVLAKKDGAQLLMEESFKTFPINCSEWFIPSIFQERSWYKSEQDLKIHYSTIKCEITAHEKHNHKLMSKNEHTFCKTMFQVNYEIQFPYSISYFFLGGEGRGEGSVVIFYFLRYSAFRKC